MADISKKVLILRSAIGVFGAERVVLELASGLAGTSFEPIVGVIENRDSASHDLARVASDMGLTSTIFSCRFPFDPVTILQIRRYLAQNKIDIVNPHGYKANFYAVFSTVGSRIRRLATCHPWTETEYNMRARVYTLLDKTLLRRMNRIAAVSDEVREQVLKKHARANCVVIPNGIDLARFSSNGRNPDLRTFLGLDSSDIVIGTVGRLVPEKGHKYLVQAAKLLVAEEPRVKVLFVGDGSMRAELEKEVADNSLQSNVLFTGVRNDIPELMRLFDIFVLPSISEGLPMVLLEAMAARKPVVATQVGQIPQVVHHDQSGILVKAGESGCLAESILGLIRDHDKAKNLGTRAWEEVNANYSCQAMTEGYIRHYEEVLT